MSCYLNRCGFPSAPQATCDISCQRSFCSREPFLVPFVSGCRFVQFASFLPQITADLLANGIDVYPQKQFDEDSEDRLINEKFRVSWQLFLAQKCVVSKAEGEAFGLSLQPPSGGILKDMVKPWTRLCSV